MARSTRRRFLQAAAATLPLLAGTPSVGAGEAPASADAALAAIVRLRFKHLSEAQVKTVQTNIQRGLAMGDALKRFTLDTADEPATIFMADVVE